ncbi:MAG: hypothetical protein WD314_11405 [Trueperaceae bacterium]
MSDLTTESVAANGSPWWLEPGVEECELCLRRVHYEVLYHCSECDRPLCPSCSVAVLERRVVVCEGCHTAESG